MSSSSTSSRVSCKFVYVEFLSESYFMTLDIDGEMQQFAGGFNVTENASGKVEKVELMFLNSETDLEFKVATITNMVVVKSGEALNASFNVVLSLPASEFASCNEALSGDVSAEKEEPMAESSDATSNHAKFVGTWKWVTLTNSNKSSYSINDELTLVSISSTEFVIDSEDEDEDGVIRLTAKKLSN